MFPLVGSMFLISSNYYINSDDFRKFLQGIASFDTKAPLFLYLFSVHRLLHLLLVHLCESPVQLLLIYSSCLQVLLGHWLKSGSILKVSEASVSRNRSTIIVPAGSNRDEGWTAFRNILAEINEASRLFILPNQENSEHSERLVGLSDDVGAGFISGHSSQPGPTSDLNVDRQVDLSSAQDEMGQSGGIKSFIRADQKRFFFSILEVTTEFSDMKLVISVSVQVAGADRSSIILPLSG
ncbi:Transcription factor Pur-alpha 1, partial [Cucurbita argyrosperma subsp. argyrosperma]